MKTKKEKTAREIDPETAAALLPKLSKVAAYFLQKYHGYGVHIDDLVSEGFHAACYAASGKELNAAREAMKMFCIQVLCPASITYHYYRTNGHGRVFHDLDTFRAPESGDSVFEPACAFYDQLPA